MFDLMQFLPKKVDFVIETFHTAYLASPFNKLLFAMFTTDGIKLMYYKYQFRTKY